MKPAFSIIFFTTFAGVAQGVAVTLAGASLFGSAPSGLAPMLWLTTALLVVALVASFFHLGHPLRAWRAALMWRTSWMSREVIVLPAFIAVIAAWAAHVSWGQGTSGWAAALAWAAIAGAVILWYCTAMIYACIRFIQEWAHPLTIVNYALIGMASGLVAACAYSSVSGDDGFAAAALPWALVATVAAFAARGVSLRRNARLKPQSTLQSATGIQAAQLKQTAMGMTGGSFNTREFFHGASATFYRGIKGSFLVLAFALPLVLLAAAWLMGRPALAVPAFASQLIGVIAERWFFFAQANHPQNLYYQVVS